ncbi:MAG: succinate dehydrogenase cytochrome b subunit [Solirubrobacterales bacterium]
MAEMWRSTIGKKTIVAVTGVVLIAYLVLHMAGNLNSLFGPGGAEPRIDWYAEWLRTFGEPLVPYEGVIWAVRAILLGAIVVHIVGVVQLNARNRAARPTAFPAKRIGRSWESRLMMLSGVLLLAFLIFHILQFTTLTIDVTPLTAGALYSNLYDAFQEWYLVVIYLAALIFLGMHLRHAIWSLCQTLGFDNPERNFGIRMGANGLTLLIVVGFALVPVLFFTGTLGEPPADELSETVMNFGGGF